MHCKNCKHWINRVDHWNQPCRLGECGRAKEPDETEDLRSDDFCADYDYESNGYDFYGDILPLLTTGPDFGCIHFFAKPENAD